MGREQLAELATFVAVAQEHSSTRAAAKLGITRPSRARPSGGSSCAWDLAYWRAPPVASRRRTPASGHFARSAPPSRRSVPSSTR